ncbi:hypothetical protein HID58_086294, partial [Brassica napus]
TRAKFFNVNEYSVPSLGCEGNVFSTLSVGTKSLASCRYKTVDKCEGGDPSAGEMVRSKKAMFPSRTESEAESRKKAHECENTPKIQFRMIEDLTAKMGAVEKIVRKGWKEDHTKAGSSTDVPEETKLLALWPVLKLRGNVGLLLLNNLLLIETTQQRLSYTTSGSEAGDITHLLIMATEGGWFFKFLDMELYMVDYTHECVSESGVPQNKQSGYCGVYCLKYIECHALGMTFPSHYLCDKNIKTFRSQMATEIFDENSINNTEKCLYKHLSVYD